MCISQGTYVGINYNLKQNKAWSTTSVEPMNKGSYYLIVIIIPSACKLMFSDQILSECLL